MNALSSAQTVNQVYDDVKSLLPNPLLARLKFMAPDYLEKKGSSIWRGRILGCHSGTIFDSAWCFYEVVVGTYCVEPPKPLNNSGGVGFVCFTENKRCGKGVHGAAVSSLVSRFAATHPQFFAGKRGEKNQGGCIYYPTTFPPGQAAKDLSNLIASTLDTLEGMKVSK